MERRALVLGCGGVAGIAWQTGILESLAAAGVDPARATTVVGTSAGAIVGAHIARGIPPADMVRRYIPRLETLGSLDAAAFFGMMWAQISPDRERALVRLARRIGDRPGLHEEAWVDKVSLDLSGHPWPERLKVVVLDAETGRGRVLGASDGYDLARAVAASAAVPGVFPGVHLDGRLFLDGGMRSPVNVDVAAHHERVIVLATQPQARARHRRPTVQLRRLPGDPAWLYVRPDLPAMLANGWDLLSAERAHLALDAGRRQGRIVSAIARRVWG